MIDFNFVQNNQNKENNDEYLSSFENGEDTTLFGEVHSNGDYSLKFNGTCLIAKFQKSASLNIQNKIAEYQTEKSFDFVSNNCNKIIKTENIFLRSIFYTSNIPNINIEINNHPEKIVVTKDQKFLNKKRKFKISFPNTFFIFEKGEDKKLREIIDEFKEKKIYKKIQNHIQKRKENSDNIRKKIKCRFLKSLKKALNKKLILVGSKETFDFLPQNFVCNISKSLNKYILDKTLEEIFSINFIKEENKDKLKNKNIVNENKYLKNKKVLEYLKENEEISEKLNYNIIKDMKLYQIFEEYLISKEFEKDIEVMKRKNEDNNYIYNYIKLACNFIDFFSQ